MIFFGNKTFENVIYMSAKDTDSREKLAEIIKNMYELGESCGARMSAVTIIFSRWG